MVILVAIVLISAPQVVAMQTKKREAAQPKQTEFEGEWIVTKRIVNGDPTGEEILGVTLTVTGFIGTVEAVGAVQYRGEFTVRMDKKELDLKVTEGRDKGQTFLGIYRIDGDKLTFCLHPKIRPKEFRSTEKSNIRLTEFVRSKDDKAKKKK